ncbi:MAG: right-handed parallel beta-helix repeat-containing protein [bacterium]|nr:right-handed parallel beta-helix repeat-containing protein [bacterium]
MKRTALLAILMFGLFTIPTTMAQIHLLGSLSGVLADTTYIVDDHIYVDTTASLLISPGARILFNDSLNFTIYGYLSAVGNATDSIYFQQLADSIAWGSIIFRIGASSSSEMSYCLVTGAMGSAINIYQTNLTISHCTITENTASWGAGIYCSSAAPIISDCEVTHNNAKKNGGGIYCTGSNPTINNCVVSFNSCNNDTFAFASGRGGGGIGANHSSSPIISNCTITDNVSHHNGGGISINDNSHPLISDCSIANNSADSSGGGIFCSSYCHPQINHCEIVGNSVLFSGGGIMLVYNVTAAVTDCDIQANSADSTGGGVGFYLSNSLIKQSRLYENSAGVYGGGIACSFTMGNLEGCLVRGNEAPQGGGLAFWDSDSGIIRNCTVYANTSLNEGGGIYLSNSSPLFENLILAENQGNSGIYFSNAIDTEVRYTDFHNNAGGNFGGAVVGIPPGLGEITTANVNRDSCDGFFNLYLEPGLINPANGDFGLTALSPCIDAGDPTGRPDPDSTVSDMGAYFHDQSILPASVLLNPQTQPILIPPGGGTFSYDLLLHNLQSVPVNLDFWVMLQLPNGNWWGPLFGPLNRTLAGGSNPNRLRTQNVPGNAPMGAYLYDGRVGHYPDDVWDHSHFYFLKQGNQSGLLSLGDWLNMGEDFDEQDMMPGSSSTPQDFILYGAYPNPFNATTAISYELRAASLVKLAVYDISGKKVAELVNGQREAGKHEATFDGSRLTSGVYICRLTCGAFSISAKAALLK